MKKRNVLKHKFICDNNVNCCKLLATSTNAYLPDTDKVIGVTSK